MIYLSTRVVLVLLAMATLLMFASASQANFIREMEGNDELRTAQNVERAFSSGAVSFIYNSNLPDWEWVSIAAGGNRTFDYFSFSALAGQTFFFDIDRGANTGVTSIDTEIALWAAGGGRPLFSIDDAFGRDPGSYSPLDPRRRYTFAVAGTYVIGVAEFNSFARRTGFYGNPPDRQDRYRLQISRDMASVPEPTTLTLMGIGLVGLAWTRRRKTVKLSA